MAHIPQIKQALGIGNVLTTVSAWRSNKIEKGAQIDLVLQRNDQIITLVEAKFSKNIFTIDKKYDEVLRNKISAFKEETHTNYAIQLCIISTYGIAQNAYAKSIVQQSLDANSLFI